MGARLVALALARYSHVPDRAFRVLVRMAVTALDDPSGDTPAGVYFGGRELLAMTLGRGVTPSTLRSVRYAIDELIAAGALDRTSSGRAGHNSVYRLTLQEEPGVPVQGEPDVPPQPVQGEPGVPPQGERGVPPQGERGVPNRGNVAFPPRNQEEPLEELLQEPIQDHRTAVTGPRGRDHPFEDDGFGNCAHTGAGSRPCPLPRSNRVHRTLRRDLYAITGGAA